MSFHSERRPIARKQCRCDQCGTPITVGTQYRSAAGNVDGEFFSVREHLECLAAWAELNYSRNMRNLDWDEGSPFLRDDDEIEDEDREWMREEHPLVASRLGWGVSSASPAALPSTKGLAAALIPTIADPVKEGER